MFSWNLVWLPKRQLSGWGRGPEWEHKSPTSPSCCRLPCLSQAPCAWKPVLKLAWYLPGIYSLENRICFLPNSYWKVIKISWNCVLKIGVKRQRERTVSACLSQVLSVQLIGYTGNDSIDHHLHSKHSPAALSGVVLHSWGFSHC